MLRFTCLPTPTGSPLKLAALGRQKQAKANLSLGPVWSTVSARTAILSNNHKKQKAEFRTCSGSCFWVWSGLGYKSPASHWWLQTVATVPHAWSSAGDVTSRSSGEVLLDTEPWRKASLASLSLLSYFWP